MIRWVIVAQCGPTHVPDVYGTWQTEQAAQEQLERWERWERRIAATFDGDPNTGIVLLVEPMFGKTAARFERDFHRHTGVELVRETRRTTPVNEIK